MIDCFHIRAVSTNCIDYMGSSFHWYSNINIDCFHNYPVYSNCIDDNGWSVPWYSNIMIDCFLNCSVSSTASTKTAQASTGTAK